MATATKNQPAKPEGETPAAAPAAAKDKAPVAEKVSTIKVEYDGDRASREAQWLFFTEVVSPKGTMFNVTFREGATPASVAEAMAVMYALEQNASQNNWQMGKVRGNYERNQSSTPTPQTRATPPPAAAQNGGEQPPSQSGQRQVRADQFHINKITISGDISDPTVDFYSANPRLKFRVIHAPSSMVKQMLMEAYPSSFEEADLVALDKVGTTMNIDWIVTWSQSPKNEKWKDLVAIESPKLGTPVNRLDPEIDPEDEIPF